MYTNKFQRYAKNIFFDIFCPKDFHSNTSLSKYFLNKLLCFRYFFTIRVSNKKNFDKENKLQWLVRPPFPWKSLSQLNIEMYYPDDIMIVYQAPSLQYNVRITRLDLNEYDKLPLTNTNMINYCTKCKLSCVEPSY